MDWRFWRGPDRFQSRVGKILAQWFRQPAVREPRNFPQRSCKYIKNNVFFCLLRLYVQTINSSVSVSKACVYKNPVRDFRLSPRSRWDSLDFWPLKMGPIGCPETLGRNYHYTLPNFPEERISEKYRSSKHGITNPKNFNFVMYFRL